MTTAHSRFHLLALVWLALLLTAFAARAAEPEAAGEAFEVSGVVSAQRQGAPDRFLARGDALYEGDVVTTSATGYVQMGLKDGTKLTLRPNTSFAVDRLRHGAGEETLSVRLLKGGVRALTGLISKRNPNGAQMRTSEATIGIRGTSFDARLCQEDCGREQPAGGAQAAGEEQPIVARVAILSGTASATAGGGQSRTLSQNGALFNGESVSTGPKSYAVLAFRDRSRITVAADSTLRLENVRFGGAKMDEGNFFVRVARGSVRALTGLLGKRDPKAVGVRVGEATIGIRGTGLDTGFTPGAGGAPGSEVFVQVWQDSVTLEAGGNSIVVANGQTGSFQPGTNQLGLVNAPPQLFDAATPRPDQIKVDFNHLFGRSNATNQPGLYVSVRDGDVELVAVGGAIVPLANGEVGFLAIGGTTPIRIGLPSFMLNDPYPLPEAGIRSLVVPLAPRPGSLICEIR